VLLPAAVAFCAVAGAAAQDSEPAVEHGFTLETIARVPAARELAVAPNGDLLVGTSRGDVDIVADAEGTPHAASVFVHLDEAPAAGVALGAGSLYVGTQFGVWRIPYEAGRQSVRGTPEKIVNVRPGGSRGHRTTSVAIEGNRLFYSVGSSCNACEESDATRAKVFDAALNGRDPHPIALGIRNAIALAANPATGAVWAGVAGQDELEGGHPYEIFDPVTAHVSPADYGWPECYENHRTLHAGHDCSTAVESRVVFPAYETPIGAVFYPLRPSGKYAFPAAFEGGAFVTLHGSWHQPPVPPRVVFVPMRGDEPVTPVNWADPDAQWREFVNGFQRPDGSRLARPTGVAVGPEGSLFVSDDASGAIYRIRPVR